MYNVKNKINKLTKQKQTPRYREHFDGCQIGVRLKGKGLRSTIGSYKIVMGI